MVAALRAGDRLAPGQIFDVYGARVYAYCHELLADHGLASDALRDTFIVASERVDELRDPDALGAWLYALARNECVRVGVSDEIPADAAAAVRGDRFVRVALDCYALLPPETRETLDLAFRHRIVDEDLGLVLGLDATEVSARVTSAQDDLEHAMTAVFAGRDREPRCPEMEELGRRFDDLDGKRIASWLGTVNKHIAGCRICGGYLREKRPLQLFEELPHAFMPTGVRANVLDTFRDTAEADHRARVGSRAGRFDEDGFPFPAKRRGSRLRGVLVPVVAIVAALAAGTALAMTLFHSGGTQGTPITGSSPSGAGTTSGPATLATTSSSATSPSTSPTTTTSGTTSTTSQYAYNPGTTTTSRPVTTTSRTTTTTKPHDATADDHTPHHDRDDDNSADQHRLTRSPDDPSPTRVAS
jgi:DNA-directed RNA polymerase specialized sigma24 family protein